jgi:hypothetical protein
MGMSLTDVPSIALFLMKVPLVDLPFIGAPLIGPLLRRVPFICVLLKCVPHKRAFIDVPLIDVPLIGVLLMDVALIDLPLVGLLLRVAPHRRASHGRACHRCISQGLRSYGRASHNFSATEIILDNSPITLLAPWPKQWSICRDLSYKICAFALRGKRPLSASTGDGYLGNCNTDDKRALRTIESQQVIWAGGRKMKLVIIGAR